MPIVIPPTKTTFYSPLNKFDNHIINFPLLKLNNNWQYLKENILKSMFFLPLDLN